MANQLQLTQSQIQLAGELEIEMMQDMYNRMMNTCQKKCIAPSYRDGELTKGEAICIDRCVAKYFEIHDRIGKKLTAMNTQQQQQQASADPSKSVGTY